MKVTFKIINDLKVSQIKPEDKEQILKEIEEGKRDCEDYIESSKRVKNAYFWTPSETSWGRSYQERKYSFETGLNGKVFSYKFEVRVSVSSRYFYVNKYTTINDNKYTLTSIKTFLKDLENLELYLTQEDVEINFSKETKSFIVSEESLKETEDVLYTELLKEFDYETLRTNKKEIDNIIIEKTVESLVELNKRQINVKKGTEIQTSLEFVEELIKSLKHLKLEKKEKLVA